MMVNVAISFWRSFEEALLTDVSDEKLMQEITLISLMIRMKKNIGQYKKADGAKEAESGIQGTANALKQFCQIRNNKE